MVMSHCLRKTKNVIDEAQTERGLFLMGISIWEIAMLVKKKRIELNTSCQTWVHRSLSLPGVRLLPLSADIAVESCDLPGEFHGDRADRIHHFKRKS